MRTSDRRSFPLLAAAATAVMWVGAGIDAARADEAMGAVQETHFVVARDGVVLGIFGHASGFGSEHEVLEFRDGQDPNIVRKIPGTLRYENITLKRGITSDRQLWRWRDLVIQDVNNARSELTIKMVRGDPANPVAIWHFSNAWPSKVTGPASKPDSNGIGVEEVTIVHEGMIREL